MGKIVKYCAICVESFAENFSFCPNCAFQLSVFEMNPVPQEIKEKLTSNETYKITFVENSSGKARQNLMLGSTLLVMSGAILSLVFSIYNADAFVSGLDDNWVNNAFVQLDNPTELIPEPISNENKKNGGGGIGGNNDENPVSRGTYSSQSENPLFAPTAKNVRLTNPDIKIQLETKGDTKRKITDNPYGDPTSKFDVPSDGPGNFGGQGPGFERGQGNIKGPGSGPVIGPGSEIGPPGTDGPGNQIKRIKEEDPPQPPKGPTVALKITDKPRAIYTDAARKNQIAGTVTLRVTFMANGSIGNIAVISGLPDGLTEQAIVAARSIRFEPAQRNGVAQTVTKQVQYTFTLY